MSTPPPRQLFAEETSAQVVTASFAGTPDPRLQRILTSLVQHLHAFVKDVELTEAEWSAAIGFLTRTGQACTGVRQEFILLSDVLGISMLVETINNQAGGGETESTVLGPFHLVESPPRAHGDTISLDGSGEPCLVTVIVTDGGGEPVPGAQIDVWQANSGGFYDVQQPGIQPESNLRGLFSADEGGAAWFRTIVPRYYPIPVDGPVGQLLHATSRHPNRPAHIHFLITAPGCRPLTTHIFVNGSPFIDSDAVFAVKDSLIRDFAPVNDAARAAAAGLPNPFRTVHFDAVLQRIAQS